MLANNVWLHKVLSWLICCYCCLFFWKRVEYFRSHRLKAVLTLYCSHNCSHHYTISFFRKVMSFLKMLLHTFLDFKEFKVLKILIPRFLMHFFVQLDNFQHEVMCDSRKDCFFFFSHAKAESPHEKDNSWSLKK